MNVSHIKSYKNAAVPIPQITIVNRKQTYDMTNPTVIPCKVPLTTKCMLWTVRIETKWVSIANYALQFVRSQHISFHAHLCIPKNVEHRPCTTHENQPPHLKKRSQDRRKDKNDRSHLLVVYGWNSALAVALQNEQTMRAHINMPKPSDSSNF